MVTDPIKLKSWLINECFMRYNLEIKYDGIRIYTDTPDIVKRVKNINTAIAIRRAPLDVFSAELDDSITSIDDERVDAFVERHFLECIKDEPRDVTSTHDIDVIRDLVIGRLKHWLATKEIDPLLNEEEITAAKDAALDMAPANPDKAIRFMLMSAFLFDDETMIINEAESHLKSYLIETSYIILKELDVTGVFDK